MSHPQGSHGGAADQIDSPGSNEEQAVSPQENRAGPGVCHQCVYNHIFKRPRKQNGKKMTP